MRLAKTSNAVILCGGRESLCSDTAVIEALRAGGGSKGFPEDGAQLVTRADPAALRALARLDLPAPDEEAAHDLVRANLRFVVTVAKQYLGQGLSLEDLINEGNLYQNDPAKARGYPETAQKYTTAYLP